MDKHVCAVDFFRKDLDSTDQESLQAQLTEAAAVLSEEIQKVSGGKPVVFHKLERYLTCRFQTIGEIPEARIIETSRMVESPGRPVPMVRVDCCFSIAA